MRWQEKIQDAFGDKFGMLGGDIDPANNQPKWKWLVNLLGETFGR